MNVGVTFHVLFFKLKRNCMNKFVVVALIVSAVAAVAAYRYYGPCCLCSKCPCAQVAEEVVVVEAPAEEVVVTDEVVATEKPADCCCGQACADQKNNDVK
jgi:hypothetical protein